MPNPGCPGLVPGGISMLFEILSRKRGARQGRSGQPGMTILQKRSPGQLSGQAMGDLCLELAGRGYLIKGIPRGWKLMLADRLLNCEVQRAGSARRVVHIQLSSDDGLRPAPGKPNLNEATEYCFRSDRVRFTSHWCEGQFVAGERDPAELKVHVEARPWFGAVLKNLLRLLVAYDVLFNGGVLLHCAAIVREGRAAVMFGHSGAGKSTTSALALANGCSVISDDINIIAPGTKGGWQVLPVPFSGTLNASSDMACPVALGGLFRLRPSGLDQSVRCSQARAVSLLAGCAPFVNQDRHRAEQLLDALWRLSGDLPVQDLFFTRSGQFLNNIFAAKGIIRHRS
jgi:hypothetical protein